MYVYVLEWFDCFIWFCFFPLLFLCDFSNSNFLSGNEDISQWRKGDKFALDRQDDTARHIDGKGKFWLLLSVIRSNS